MFINQFTILIRLRTFVVQAQGLTRAMSENVLFFIIDKWIPKNLYGFKM